MGKERNRRISNVSLHELIVKCLQIVAESTHGGTGQIYSTLMDLLSWKWQSRCTSCTCEKHQACSQVRRICHVTKLCIFNNLSTISDTYSSTQNLNNVACDSLKHYDTVASRHDFTCGKKWWKNFKESVTSRIRLRYLYPWQDGVSVKLNRVNCVERTVVTVWAPTVECRMTEGFRVKESRDTVCLGNLRTWTDEILINFEVLLVQDNILQYLQENLLSH